MAFHRNHAVTLDHQHGWREIASGDAAKRVLVEVDIDENQVHLAALLQPLVFRLVRHLDALGCAWLLRLFSFRKGLIRGFGVMLVRGFRVMLVRGFRGTLVCLFSLGKVLVRGLRFGERRE